MAQGDLRDEFNKALSDAVVNMDEDAARETAQKVIEEGLSAYDAIMNGLAAGMEIVGELYDTHEYFVPELLLCADALYAGLDILKPHIKPEEVGTSAKGQDIGKNIIKMMFEVAGFTVHDLGRDVPLEQFVEEQMKTDSDIVALSAMMTTTMMGMKKVVEMIKARNPHVAIMLGGAPVTKDVTELFGADGYADSAGNAVQEAIKMVSRLREMQGGTK